jgi:hypothetical protein
MRKSAPVVLALVAVALLGAPAPASAQPTLTLARDCSRFPPLHGLSLRLSGFPPTTLFQGTLARPTGSVLGPVGLITDPAGSFSIGPFTDESAGTWTATITWSGGTLVQSLFVDRAPPATAEQCKDGGWRTFGVFRNQGDCVGFVTTRGKNEAGRNVPEPPGSSNPNREDSVTSGGTTNCLGGTFEVDARSGAGSEHPTGHVTCGTFFSGPVTCLNVTGNVALLNITTTDFGPLALRITDNGASGDRVEAIPGPGCAAPQPSYLDLGFAGGDIAVVDNGPRLARPQAGQ